MENIFVIFFKESGIYTLCIIHVPLGLRLILQKQTSVVPPPVPRLISGRNGEKFCSLNKRNNQTALLQENIHEIYRCTLTLKHRDYYFFLSFWRIRKHSNPFSNLNKTTIFETICVFSMLDNINLKCFSAPTFIVYFVE